MKLSISNIAWEDYQDENIFALLHTYGVSGMELAPTKIWPEWDGITTQSIRDAKQFFDAKGFEIPAMQAILFGKAELQLFDPSTHHAFFEHFKLLADLAYELNTKVLVFGAPKNRRRFQVSMEDANKIAVDFFTKAGEIFIESGACLAIENNPVEYMCDYLTNNNDVQNIVKSIDSEGIKAHLDSAGVHMCKGNLQEVIKESKGFVHYHISEPMLNPIYENSVDHQKALRTLREIDYKNWISIEMKQTSNEYVDIEKSLSFLQQTGVL